MKFQISREAILKPLALVAGVVERRQTLPVLSNVLLVVDGNQLSMTGTDLEVELVGRVSLEESGVSGEITVPARKLMDICKTLPEGAAIAFQLEDHKLLVTSGRSRFSLSTLPAKEFPNVESGESSFDLELSQSVLRRLIDRTSVAMAQQDVRYYLNGMLFELEASKVTVVATDGHRLALSYASSDSPISEKLQVIVPRKGILELARLLNPDDETSVRLVFSPNHVQAVVGDMTFTSKLIDGKFPDYRQVIPEKGKKTILAEREDLKQVLSRVAILSNEKYRGVRLILNSGQLQVFANNPEQEEAEELLPVHYEGDRLEIGFNVSYLLDVLSVTHSVNVRLSLSDANSSALIEEVTDKLDSLYVVMPMRL